jgi:hypothetical protein
MQAKTPLPQSSRARQKPAGKWVYFSMQNSLESVCLYYIGDRENWKVSKQQSAVREICFYPLAKFPHNI